MFVTSSSHGFRVRGIGVKTFPGETEAIMPTAYEMGIEEARQRRKRMWIIGLCVVAVLVVLFGAALFYVTQPVFGAAPGNASGTVDPKRLETHVRMLAETFHPRDHLHPENLDKVAAYIGSELKAAGGEVSEQPFKTVEGTYRNVIATFGPDTPERIVLGAHYDTCGPQPGADDNASAVAGLIELAYLLGKEKLPMRVELVAYTLEEPPYFRTPQMGSAVHARKLKEANARVRLMVSIEMIGYFTDAPDSQKYPLPGLSAVYPSKGNFIAVVGRVGETALVRDIKTAMTKASPLPVYSINAPAEIPGHDFSDHLNYWNEGYPAVMVTDTSFYRNNNYHQKSDRPETLDYRRMAQVVEGLKAATLAVAGRK